MIEIALVMSAVILGMAKKQKENVWRQLSLVAVGKPAVRYQRVGESIKPFKMVFGCVQTLAELYDLDRLRAKTNEKGWLQENAEVLVIEDERTQFLPMVITSRPLKAHFMTDAADAIDGGAKDEDIRVEREDKTKDTVQQVLLENMPTLRLNKGSAQSSPYFVELVEDVDPEAL
tara:strand:+ start:3406 stop:3927 length:522 start_codon:yes stop_codon:yes gene_type:complete